jgi:hypothetical protein
MRENVSGNIKSWGGERILQGVKVPSGSCRGTAGPYEGASVSPKESINQPTKELWKTLSQNTDVLRFELTEPGKIAASLHAIK